ncbi:hypothetical protein SRABI84_04772 [Peribacillus simplex]|uniref:P-loop NTPase n=1 Tax=Peribacillus simplex TaxID=1478 RepID=UPI001DD72696|nr:hypothetical protein [Peribacillus simplex]CAH0308654.1 hypothetical protein SRABI84_04772 [Peribacillus simplex]
MEELEFIYKAENKNLILFIHGFTGGKETWNPGKESLPFPNLLKNDERIEKLFDIAIVNYYTKPFSLDKYKTIMNGFQRLFKFQSNVSYRNLGIEELSKTLETIIDHGCRDYENIVIIAHSMGGLVSKSYILNELNRKKSCKVKLFLSLAVPHNGVNWATIGSKLYSGNEQLVDLAAASKSLSEINRQWFQLASKLPDTVYFYAQHDKVVQKQEAIGYDVQEDDAKSLTADHFTICKPKDSRDFVFVAVRDKILESWEKGLFNKEHGLDMEENVLKKKTNSLLPWGYNKNGIIEITSQYIQDRGIPSLGACQSYYKGHPVSWEIVKNKFTAPRKLTKQILDSFNNSTFQVAVITGSGGEGKSTVLMQIGVSLLEQGFKIIYVDGEPKIPDSIFKNNQGPLALIIDDAYKLNNFSDVARFASTLAYPVKIVMAARKNEWANSRAFKTLGGSLRRVIEDFKLESIDKEEAEIIANLLVSTGTTDNSRSVEELKDSLLKDSNGFLLAAMITTTHGKPLEKILFDVIENISKFKDASNVLEVLAMVVVIEKINMTLAKRIVCSERLLSKASKVSAGNYKNKLDGEILPQSGSVHTRHEKIAEIIYSILFVENHFNIDEEIILKKILYAVGSLSEQLTNPDEVRFLLEVPKYYANMPECGFVSELYSAAVEANRFRAEIRLSWAKYEYKKGNAGNISRRENALQIARRGALDTNNDSLWKSWAEWEKEKSGIGSVEEEETALWIAEKGARETNYHALWTLWAKWEKEKSGIGSVEEEGTALWIAKIGSRETNYHALWTLWAEWEKEKSGIGSSEEEESALWIAKKGARETNFPELWSLWAKWEKENGIGSIEEEESALWIAKKGARETNFHALWALWAKWEKEKSDIGSVGEEESALWIAKKGARESKSKSPELWALWAKWEKENGIGSVGEEESALWIAKKGARETNYHALWTLWAEWEKEKSGIGSIEEEESALWIAKKGARETNYHALWTLWAEWEKEKSGIGSIEEEESALWIAKKGARESKSPELWALWAEWEKEKSGIGSIEEEESALWIAKKGARETKFPELWSLWAKWEKENGIGSIEEEESALWIARRGALDIEHPSLWRLWAELQKEKRGAGSVEEKETALWILSRGKEIHPNHWSFWILSAKIEEERGKIENARLLYKECERRKALTKVAFPWYEMELKLELNSGYIRGANEEYSARWILEKSLELQLESKIEPKQNLWELFIWREINSGNWGSPDKPYSALWLYNRCKKENPNFLKTPQGKEIEGEFEDFYKL